MTVESGFVLVDKPEGWTSHDVVAKARRLFGIKKIGHAGTLDPMATGLLILGIGKATRLLRFLTDLPKAYEAEVKFGVATDTLDADGKVLERRPMNIDAEDLAGLLPWFCGSITQTPPMASAVKVGGKRLYELARKGREVERPARQVQVYDLQLMDFEPGAYPIACLLVTCGRGTYVRVLADDIARALGGRAHLIYLRREANGRMSADDAYDIDALEYIKDHDKRRGSENLFSVIVPPGEGLRHLSRVEVDEEQAAMVRAGRRIPLPEERAGKIRGGEGAYVRVMTDDRLWAVYRLEGGDLAPEVVLG